MSEYIHVYTSIHIGLYADLVPSKKQCGGKRKHVYNSHVRSSKLLLRMIDCPSTSMIPLWAIILLGCPAYSGVHRQALQSKARSATEKLFPTSWLPVGRFWLLLWGKIVSLIEHDKGLRLYSVCRQHWPRHSVTNRLFSI